jgi:DNA polymerase I-like protein with 3'-5' exonuclease and polymerase domains
MILALDTETTGVDFFHGCAPFMATACDGEQNYIWEGEVNPYNREVYWDKEEINHLQYMIDKADQIIMHNAQFDVRALSVIGVKVPFSKVEDTLIASHLICSDDSHGLKDLAVKYLRYWDDDEDDLRVAAVSARAIAARKGYEIAKQGHKHFPGLKKSEWWKQDMWLAPEECRKYATKDAERTWLLWRIFLPEIVHGGYWKAYERRKNLLPICYDATTEGLHLNVHAAMKYIKELEIEILEIRKYISKEMDAAVLFEWEKKEHLVALIHHHLGLPRKYLTDKGFASTNKESLAKYAEMTDHPTMAAVMRGIKLATQLRYATGYIDWLADDGCIHSNTNITGTRETRQSSNNPNLQNITAKLAELFQPKQGYVWWYADFKNIELRLWAYATNNEELIAAFEQGKSVHEMIFEVIHPDQAKQYINNKDKCSQELKNLYRDVKAGNFALIYGATDNKADETYKRKGATQLIFKRFPGIKEYMAQKGAEVEANLTIRYRPCITTLLGYPLDVPIDEPYKSCNYYIQGGAGMIMGAAMHQIYSNELYKKSKSIIIQQVHDSLRIQVPINRYTIEATKMFKHTMENCVIEEFGPTPVDTDLSYHPQDEDLLIDMGLVHSVPF